jgi:hypothetical protein
MYIVSVREPGQRARNLDHARDRIEAEYLTEVYAMQYGGAARVTYRAVARKGRGRK